MQAATVCFLIKGNPPQELLLGLKKSGFGAGKYAGIGGKVEKREEVETAVLREVSEEINVQIPRAQLQNRGRIQFIFPAKPAWNHDVAIFRAAQWKGIPQESDEIKPVWFPVNAIPCGQMWQDAAHWLPAVLEGKRIQATIAFQDDNESVATATIETWLVDKVKQ